MSSVRVSDGRAQTAACETASKTQPGVEVQCVVVAGVAAGGVVIAIAAVELRVSDVLRGKTQIQPGAGERGLLAERGITDFRGEELGSRPAVVKAIVGRQKLGVAFRRPSAIVAESQAIGLFKRIRRVDPERIQPVGRMQCPGLAKILTFANIGAFEFDDVVGIGHVLISGVHAQVAETVGTGTVDRYIRDDVGAHAEMAKRNIVPVEILLQGDTPVRCAAVDLSAVEMPHAVLGILGERGIRARFQI